MAVEHILLLSAQVGEIRQDTVTRTMKTAAAIHRTVLLVFPAIAS
jgi:hypothetical protein